MLNYNFPLLEGRILGRGLCAHTRKKKRLFILKNDQLLSDVPLNHHPEKCKCVLFLVLLFF